MRRLATLPAQTLGLHGRGLLKPGYFADAVVFDPAVIAKGWRADRRARGQGCAPARLEGLSRRQLQGQREGLEPVGVAPARTQAPSNAIMTCWA